MLVLCVEEEFTEMTMSNRHIYYEDYEICRWVTVNVVKVVRLITPMSQYTFVKCPRLSS